MKSERFWNNFTFFRKILILEYFRKIINFLKIWLWQYRPNFDSPENFREILGVCQRCIRMFVKLEKACDRFLENSFGECWRSKPIATSGLGAVPHQIFFVPPKILLCPEKFVSNILEQQVCLAAMRWPIISLFDCFVTTWRRVPECSRTFGSISSFFA